VLCGLQSKGNTEWVLAHFTGEENEGDENMMVGTSMPFLCPAAQISAGSGSLAESDLPGSSVAIRLFLMFF
jgi:hypothetical protein